MLYETVRDLTSTLSTRVVVERLLDRVLAHLDSEIASILLIGDDGRLRVAHARGLPECVVESTSLELGEGISGHVAETGRSLLIRDIEKHARFARRNHERYYTHSALSVPLRQAGRVIGVINVNNRRDHRAFSTDHLSLMEAIAGHAAIALSNAARFEDTARRAREDALTGLANHGHFWSALEVELARARRYGRQLSLVFLDVDHFKRFNDTHGHRAGDAALVQLGRVLRERTRVHDLCARYGGEEFAVLLPETPREGAVAFARKVRRALTEIEPGDLPERVTVSVGIAVYPEDTSTPTELVELADRRLYAAKSGGRDCIRAEP